MESLWQLQEEPRRRIVAGLRQDRSVRPQRRRRHDAGHGRQPPLAVPRQQRQHRVLRRVGVHPVLGPQVEALEAGDACDMVRHAGGAHRLEAGRHGLAALGRRGRLDHRPHQRAGAGVDRGAARDQRRLCLVDDAGDLTGDDEDDGALVGRFILIGRGRSGCGPLAALATLPGLGLGLVPAAMHLDLEAVAVLLSDPGRIPGEQRYDFRRGPVVVLQPADDVHELLGALALRRAALDQPQKLAGEVAATILIGSWRLPDLCLPALGLARRLVQPRHSTIDLCVDVRQRVRGTGQLIAGDDDEARAGAVGLDFALLRARHLLAAVHVLALRQADNAKAGARDGDLGVARGLSNQRLRPLFQRAGRRVAAIVHIERAPFPISERRTDPVGVPGLHRRDRGRERAPSPAVVALGFPARRVGDVRHLRQPVGAAVLARHDLPPPH